MSITPDNGSKNKRRRYFANGRSRTIELSTLAEIDEEEYSKGVIEGLGPSSTTSNPEQPTATTTLTTQDDMCIGTLGSFKSLKRGSVKAQALKLSERLAQKVAAENAAKEEEQQQHHQQHQQQAQQHQTSSSVKLRRSRTFDNTEFNAQEWQAQHQAQQQQQQQQQSQQQSEFAPQITRHPLSRSASFVTAPTPLIVYSMPAPPPPSAIPPHSQQADRMSALIDSRCESRLISDYSMPLYYALPPPTPQNAPQPIFLPFIPPSYMEKQQMFCLPYDMAPPPMIGATSTANGNMLPGQRRKMKSGKREESWCSRICCAGLAQLLWTVVCIISFGIIASLILALCYM